MPWTLYRFIVKELLKLMLASAAVLVVVISFAASIKPMAEGLLGPDAMFKFLLFTAPTMLVYVLPFAAAFASTLVFLRMTNDNEIVACAASGMSYGQVLIPVMILGLALTMSLFALSNFVIPRFNMAAAQMIERDLMSMLVSRMNSGQPFEMGNSVLYADSAVTRDSPRVADSELQPERAVELRGVVVGQTDDEGVITGDATAEVATAALWRVDGQSWVTIRLRNVMFYQPQRGQLLFQETHDWPALRLPNLFSNRPKYLSWPELRRLRREPERLDLVLDRKMNLARSIAAVNLTSRLERAVGRSDAPDAPVFEEGRSGSRYTLRAPIVGVEGDRIVLRASGPATDRRRVIVEFNSDTIGDRRYEADAANVTVTGGDDPARPVVDIELLETTVYDLRPNGQFTQWERMPLPPLVSTEPMLAQPVSEMSIGDLLSLSITPPYDASPRVAASAHRLSRELGEMNRRIFGQLHERTASSIACLLLLLMGAMISMLCRGSLPLVVFFWSFLLAIVSIVIMNSGTNMTKDVDMPLALTLGVLWSGNVMLAVVLVAVYHRLAKH